MRIFSFSRTHSQGGFSVGHVRRSLIVRKERRVPGTVSKRLDFDPQPTSGVFLGLGNLCLHSAPPQVVKDRFDLLTSHIALVMPAINRTK